MAETTGIRLSDEELARIDAYLEKTRAKHPGMRMTRSDAMRDLIERGLRASAAQDGDEPETTATAAG